MSQHRSCLIWTGLPQWRNRFYQNQRRWRQMLRQYLPYQHKITQTMFLNRRLLSIKRVILIVKEWPCLLHTRLLPVGHRQLCLEQPGWERSGSLSRLWPRCKKSQWHLPWVVPTPWEPESFVKFQILLVTVLVKMMKRTQKIWSWSCRRPFPRNEPSLIWRVECWRN